MTARVVRRSAVPAKDLRLSVVVPCFDVGQLGTDAVQSVLRQTMRELEVIAVDDGSRDDTLGRLLRLDDPRLTCVTQVNRGLAAARNTGIGHARGPFIGFCDGDDLWHPEKAERHLAMMEVDDRLGVTFSHSAYLDESGAPTGQLLLTRCASPGTADLVRRNHVGNGSTPIVRRQAFASAGLFDETLTSCEDFEMWVRLSVRTDYRFQLVPETLTGYRVRRGSLMHDYDRYLGASRHLVRCLRAEVPGYSDADGRRTYAEHLRISSRKAFSGGQVALSRRLLLEALRTSPSMALRDVRTAAMIALHLSSVPLLASGDPTAFYRVGRSLLRRAYARLYPAPSGDAWSVPGAFPAPPSSELEEAC